ncbi:MAG: 2-polyprenyl-6-methoxyphenol hydroxylase-like oxidoreductase [Nostoc sp. TH1S01]|nr:2-polyprenyl-6-methoxyphenol hydroxylase-like oxidoreductase [Nostoc sp. TH1S01]
MSATTINIDTEQPKAEDGITRAIVIGSGIAGLVTAHLLTKHFEQVIIIERDRLQQILSDHHSEKPAPRSGVPQSHQTHVLLTRGQILLDQLFPGLIDELASKGCPLVDWTADCQLLLPNGQWNPRFSSGITTRACSRNLLESVIRQRLVNYHSVKFLVGTQVTGLLTNANNTAVIGVELQNDKAANAHLYGQLIVDASGRSSKTPQWLQKLGYQKPQQTVVNSFLGYATRCYESLSGDLNCQALYLMPHPPHTRGGSLFQVEDGRWMVCLLGVGRDYPPTDELGFLNFAQSLVSPVVYQSIKHGQPISPIYGYQRTENRWCHYEKLSSLPENLVVLGDAVCAFNPVYGQGMSVATMGALTLDKCLQQQRWRSHNDLIGLARYFQQQLAKVNLIPWMMATSEDFRWSTTLGKGKRPDLMTRFMHWYLAQAIKTSSAHPDIYKLYIEVIHLLKPPTAFFQPNILAQVLLNWSLKLGRTGSELAVANWEMDA